MHFALFLWPLCKGKWQSVCWYATVLVCNEWVIQQSDVIRSDSGARGRTYLESVQGVPTGLQWLPSSNRTPFSKSNKPTRNSIPHWLLYGITRTTLSVPSSWVGSVRYAIAQNSLSYSTYLLFTAVSHYPLCLSIMPPLVTCKVLATVRCPIVLWVIFILFVSLWMCALSR